MGEGGSGPLQNSQKNKESVMETPDRNNTQIIAPMYKFEDSPVFDFLNSLSPIKPVESVCVAHTFCSPSFASPPSIFTSPHLSSRKECRFPRRYQLGDPSKPEFACDNVDKDDTDKVIVHTAPHSFENQENFSSGGSVQASMSPPHGCSKLVADVGQRLNYHSDTSNRDQTPFRGLQTRVLSEMNGRCEALEPHVGGGYGIVFPGIGANMEGVSQVNENRDAAGCEWELISDVADLLIFSSSSDAEAHKISMGSETALHSSVTNNACNAETLLADDCVDRFGEGGEPEDQFPQTEEGNELKEVSESQVTTNISRLGVKCKAGVLIDSVDPETGSNLCRGMRRRSLVFELSGPHRNRIHETSTFDVLARDQQLVSVNTRNEYSRVDLSDIGLHVNALATTSRDCKVVNNETFLSGRKLLLASSAINHHSLSRGGSSSSKLGNVMRPDAENSPSEEVREAPGYMNNEEYSESSPKKKRYKMANGDVGACKRCNCKKSKCLKLYCECFAAGVYCVEPCSCIDCFNKPIHEDTVLATRKQIESRNPLAFAPKVIRTSDPLSETDDVFTKTPASARHKRGCNCKKSGCLKKYCECYQGGVGCSINCRCEGCKNAFGRKDGSDAELEEEESQLSERSGQDQKQQRILIPSESEQQNPDFSPASPLPFGRPEMRLPFSTSNKPPRSTFLRVGSSSVSYATKHPNSFRPRTEFDKIFGSDQEDEIPEILQTDASPVSGVKSASPNSKRVSPPHFPRGISLGQRSSRKLILQSIPSFPSLTPKH